MDLLSSQHRPTFQLYYTAAHYLQLVYSDHLNTLLGTFDALPDFFSAALGISAGESSKDQLKKLARRHQEISGINLNWYGTQHSAQRVLSRLEREQVWAVA